MSLLPVFPVILLHFSHELSFLVLFHVSFSLFWSSVVRSFVRSFILMPFNLENFRDFLSL